jgi:type I restriction enzyme S subunit
LAAPGKGSIAGGPFGSDLVSADYVSEGVPVIRGTNLPPDQRLSLSGLVFVTEAKADSLHLNCAHPGDLVFTQRGTLGQVGLIPLDSPIPRYLISQSQMKMTVDQQKADPLYLYYYFRLPSTVRYIENHALQAGVPHINLGILRKLEVMAPPLGAQKKIAAILSAYDDLIANNQRRIALLEGMAEEIYREWFVRMRFPGAKNSAAAAKRPFEELCVLSRGFDLPDADMQAGDVPVVASTSIKGFHNVAKVEPPVVTTGRSGSLGTVLFVNQPAWPLNTALYVKNFKGNSPYVVYFTLKSLRLENFNAGAGVPTLNRNHLAGIRVFVPPKSVQREFDDRIGPALATAEQLRKANQLLVDQRDALLPRLISGKLRVDHLDVRLPPSMRAEAEAVA